ncbi:MAG: H-NS histone family protein, partial [Candidatus Competibacteraceae bacterium]|nr:H-NS histone family protein [Candidatus Competibacteraceae bacterium]
VKYRNPADPTQTWSGKGKRPNWLNEALTQGHKLEEFSLENQ